MIASLSVAAAFAPSRPYALVAPLSVLRLLDRSSKEKLWNPLKKNRLLLVRRGGGCGICRADLLHDAPFAAAIGACVLSSLILPALPSGGAEEDEDGGGAMDSTDVRLAVMGIVSFIPYFNWLSWVFAWMDSGKQRYLVYSIVYLVPYLRTNLSLSPEESWLPISSIVVCILHIQLEASIRNGDFEGINYFNQTLKALSGLAKQKDSVEVQVRGGSTTKGKVKKRPDKLPSNEKSRDVEGWGIPKKTNREVQPSDEKDVDATEN